MPGKNFTAQELQGHRITVTSPGPIYQTIITDLETGLTIDNATAITITGDVSGEHSQLQAIVRLDDDGTIEEVPNLAIYNVHLEAVVAQTEAEQEHVTEPVLPAIETPTVEGEAQ